MTIAVLGAGAFGTALACALADAGQEVFLWSRSAQQAKTSAATRKPPRLPDITFPKGVSPISNLATAANAEILLLAVPAQKTAQFLAKHAAQLPKVPLVLCAKGIDLQSFQLQSDVATTHAPNHPVAVLTGPGFATEIARGLPTALTLACEDAALGKALQRHLSTDRLRLYLSTDTTGAQLGGALKNVIAIGAGIVIGAGLGESARAALMTRGFAEMRRLGTAMGGVDETFNGLSGLGDLTLTCGSDMSRNFAQGLTIGSGVAQGSSKTVEGVATAQAACTLAERHKVEMPVAQVVAAILSRNITVDEAIDALLSRPLKQE
ncbi:glycerol-3-phosphate dehydrogenase [Rhodobacterales bacterium 52_120_T64]|nr:glycerol-3-phosphate dehydrogenase [Rhodobacterales bacterium 52_120_T64]